MGTMSASLHHITKMEVGTRDTSGWLTITGDGGRVTLFVDGRLAEKIVEAFDEHHDWLSGQEGPSFEDALAMKCDAQAREAAAREMK